MGTRLVDPPPIFILDTSVFLRDALSRKAAPGAATVLLRLAASIGYVVICDEIEAEIVETLVGKAEYTRAQVAARYAGLLAKARRVRLPDERHDHLKAVRHDVRDTMLVRAAEAVSDQCADVWVPDQLHLLVSENTNDLRPNHWFAGFEFVNCSTALKRIEAHTIDV